MLRREAEQATNGRRRTQTGAAASATAGDRGARRRRTTGLVTRARPLSAATSSDATRGRTSLRTRASCSPSSASFWRPSSSRLDVVHLEIPGRALRAEAALLLEVEAVLAELGSG